MSGFMRLGGQDIFSGIEITAGKAKRSASTGLGI